MLLFLSLAQSELKTVHFSSLQTNKQRQQQVHVVCRLCDCHLKHMKPTIRQKSPKPLWQYVSLRSSPVLMLAIHRSLLLMKAIKSGCPGQILGSMRVPEHWLFISTGFTGADC